MPYGSINVDKVVSSDGVTSGGLYGFKNRIFNGAMMIDQRNAGASVSPAASQYTLDRWSAVMNAAAAKYSVQRNAGSVTPPSGFSNYLGVTSLGAYTVTAGEIMAVQQIIEGFNIADLAWGTATAQAVTLSFWVRSSLTGTFGGAIRQGSGARSYPFTYTISAANTWEQKSINIAGDTSGTYALDNTAGLILSWGFGVGSTYSGTAGSWSGSNFVSATGATSVVGTSGATFYITGVQLEKGSTATSFDYRPYGTELQLCQRYCLVDTNSSSPYRWFATGFNQTVSTGAIFSRFFPVTMRTTPSLTVSSGTAFLVDAATSQSTTNVTDAGYATPHQARIQATVAAGLVPGQGSALASDGVSSLRSITYSAEL